MKTGLYFGTFNPIHIGHLAIANYMVAFTEIEQLWFVVSPQNPFKEEKTLLNESDRLQMVELAIGGDDRFRASDIEFGLSRPSYTIDTLVHLEKKYPDHEFYLVMGSDNLTYFSIWKNSNLILQHHNILTYPRPGYNIENQELPPRVQLANAPQMEISASFIREAIASGKDIRHYIPAKTWEYICKNKFYR